MQLSFPVAKMRVIVLNSLAKALLGKKYNMRLMFIFKKRNDTVTVYAVHGLLLDVYNMQCILGTLMF